MKRFEWKSNNYVCSKFIQYVSLLKMANGYTQTFDWENCVVKQQTRLDNKFCITAPCENKLKEIKKLFVFGIFKDIKIK